MRLEGKVAVVTGGGSGIGKATAKLFAAEGANTVVVDRYAEDAVATVSDIEAQQLPEAVAVTADVGDDDDLRELAAVCRDRYGRVDVLVNNAGVRDYGPVTERSADDWDRIYRVNLRGAGLTSRYLLPLMIDSGGGAVVNVSSVHAWSGRPGMALYDSMKAGLLGLTRSMACDHADAGVRVNAVLPGQTLTEFHVRRAHAAGQELDESVTQTPYEGGPGLLKRQATPMEVAYANLFLSCDESSYITGTAIAVDAGISATSQTS